MYNYIKGYVKQNYEWKELDISNVSLATLLNDYQNAKFIVKYDTDTIEFIASLFDNMDTITSIEKSQTLSQWLGTFTEQSLISTTAPRGLVDITAVRIFDPVMMRFKVESSNINYSPEKEIPDGLKVDLRIRANFKTKIDIYSNTNVMNNMLITVNGQVVETFESFDWVYVLGAATKMQVEKSNVLQAVDFSYVGGITKVRLTQQNVTAIPETPSDKINGIRRVKVKTTQSLGNKTLMSVMDGHIFVPGDYTKMYDANTVILTIDVRKALLRNMRRMGKDLRFAAAGDVGGNGFDKNTFDPVKYITTTYSLLIICNSPDIAVHRERVTNIGVYGQYFHYRCPKGLIFYENGEMVPYYINDFSPWGVSIATQDNRRVVPLISKINWTTAKGIGATAERLPKFNNLHKTMEAYVTDIYKF